MVTSTGTLQTKTLHPSFRVEIGGVDLRAAMLRTTGAGDGPTA